VILPLAVVGVNVLILLSYVFDKQKVLYERASKRGASPSFFFFPLYLLGEGDKGGEVDKKRDSSLPLRSGLRLRMTRLAGGIKGEGVTRYFDYLESFLYTSKT